MEPKAVFIAELAAVDPIAAYGILLGIPRIPISINASGSFSSAALNQLPIEAALDTTIAQRTWISNLAYTTSMPNCFAGNIFKPQFDFNTKLIPGISVRLTVQSGPRYLVSPEFTPIENLSNLFSQPGWVAGWPLFKQQSIQVEFQLTQAPPFSVGSNAPPYNVTLTFNCWQFLDHTVDEVSVDVAACELRKAGFYVPALIESP